MGRSHALALVFVGVVTAGVAGAVVAAPASAAPSADLVITASPDAPAAITAGTTVVVTYAVTNTGDAAFSRLDVTTVENTGTGTLTPATCVGLPLAPGASTTCTADYTVTQRDVDSGGIVLSAFVTATGNPGETIDTATRELILDAVRDPGLALTKSVTPASGPVVAGGGVTYSYAITNTGTVTVTGLTVVEGLFTGTGTLGAISCPATTLVPGETVTCTAPYTLTSADVARGTLSNTATATGGTPEETVVTSPASTATRTLATAVATPTPSPSSPAPTAVDPAVLADTGSTAGFGALGAAAVLLLAGGLALVLTRRVRRV